MKTETSEKESSKAIENLIALILIPVLFPIAAIYSGFVVSKLWGWFIVPTFHTFAVSTPAAIGLVLLASYVRSRSSSGNESALNGILSAFAGGMIANSTALALGFIVKSWL